MQRQQEVQIGDVFGRLVVVASAGVKESPNGIRRRAYRCMCSCGREIVATGTLLKSGGVKSCGCWRRDRMKTLNRKHGGYGTRLYMCWIDMRRRCSGYRVACAKNYTGRGITVCKAWQQWETFRDWAMEHGYADDLTIDRIDNNKGYSPSNCRWVITSQQNNNQQRTRWVDTPEGRMSLADAVRKFSPVCYSTVSARVRHGWDWWKAITAPRVPNDKRRYKHGL